MNKLKKVIYTCIVGGYDELRQPEAVDVNYDFICFTNDFREPRIGVWQIRPIPFSCKDVTRLSRYVKILPHRVLEEYDVSVWMDAGIQITGDEFYRFLEDAVASRSLIAQVPHRHWDCVYEDMKAVLDQDRVGFWPTYRQYRHLRREGHPVHYGLYENNLILRFHKDPMVEAISEEWWREYMKYSKRDQFSLVNIYRKRGFTPALLFGDSRGAADVPFLWWHNHAGKQDFSSVKGVRRALFKVRWTLKRLLTRLLIK